MNFNRYKTNQDGLVAIVVVLTITVMLTLMVSGFAALMDRELQQSTDRELAIQANYAAESGVNDARNFVVSSAVSVDTGGSCLDTNNLVSANRDYFVPGGTMSTTIPGLVRYTCVNVDANPNELVYNIPAGTSKVIKVITSDVLSNLYFSWNNLGADASTGSTALSMPGGVAIFPDDANFKTANPQATGVLRTTIYPISGSNANLTSAGDQNANLESLARNYVMFPNDGNGVPGNANFVSDNGVTVPGNCKQTNYINSPLPYLQSKHYCNTRVSNLVAPAASPTATVSANGASSTTVTQGSPVTITWTAANSSSCTAAAQPANAAWAWTNPVSNPASGSATINNMQAGTHFILSCTGPGGGVNAYATVNVQAPPAYTKNGSNYISFGCQRLPNPAVSCTTEPNGTSVFDWENYYAGYSVYTSGAPTADYMLTLNYGNHTTTAWPPSSNHNYSFNVDIYVGTEPTPRINDWKLSPDGSSATIDLGSISHATSNDAIIFIVWDNNFWMDCPGNPTCYDPNFRIDSVVFTRKPLPAAPPAISLPAVPSATTDTFYYVKLTALYRDLTVSVQGSNTSNASIDLKKAQAVVDVTAKGNNALKRVQSRISFETDYDYPEYTIESMATLCKRIRMPQLTAATYGNATYDDPNAADTYAGGECSAGGNIPAN